MICSFCQCTFLDLFAEFSLDLTEWKTRQPVGFGSRLSVGVVSYNVLEHSELGKLLCGLDADKAFLFFFLIVCFWLCICENLALLKMT